MRTAVWNSCKSITIPVSLSPNITSSPFLASGKPSTTTMPSKICTISPLLPKEVVGRACCISDTNSCANVIFFAIVMPPNFQITGQAALSKSNQNNNLYISQQCPIITLDQQSCELEEMRVYPDLIFAL